MCLQVDNMFAAGGDESYCSQVGTPVTTLALLLVRTHVNA